MTLKEFNQIPVGEAKCELASKQCSPSIMATKMLLRGEDIFLYCDQHAPDNVKERAQDIDNRFSGLQPANLEDTVSRLSGPGLAQLRSRLTRSFGIRLQSTGDAATAEPLTRVIMQTLDASPENPILVEFDQHILAPFTGPGQFDLVERDSRRQVFDGTSAGGTPILGSETMNWQPGNVDKWIRVGINPRQYYRILSVEDPQHITLSGIIALPSIELTLTMDGENEVTIATKAGFTDGVTTGGHSHFEKPITVDKVYSVVFVPGTAGDGIFSIKPRELYHTDPIPPPEDL